MANRFPLIVDSSSTSLKEIPSGDNLDLNSVGVVNAGVITATGAFIGAAVTINNGGIDLGVGVLTASSYTGNASGLSTDASINTTGIITCANANITGIITCSSFVGGLIGNADTASGLANDPSVTCNYIVGSGVSVVGVVTASSFDGNATGLSASASVNTTGIITCANAKVTGIITATTLVGNVTGDVSGNAGTFTVTANNTADETVYPLFVDGATGSQGGESDTGFTYNPSTGTLTASTFSGSATEAAALATNATGTNLTLSGNLTVQGTETIINTDELNVQDKTIGIGSTNAPSASSQDGAGAIIYGQTHINILYDVDKAALGISTGVSVSGFVTATTGTYSGTVAAANFNSTSDAAVKENVSLIEDAVDKIVQVDGVNFTWKETGLPSIGVIAQNVETVFPELVTGTDKKAVNYNGLVGVLIETVKEQQKQIENLQEKVAQLQKWVGGS